MKLLPAYHALFGLTLLTPPAHALAQLSSQPSGGDIDFTAYSSFPTFRQCLKQIFAPYLQYGVTVPGENVGCIMNECLCQPQNIASNEPMLYTQASRECSETKDAMSATQILDGYCSSLGFTEREGEKAAVTTGGGGDGGGAKPKETPAAITTTEQITKTAANGAIVTETSVVVIEGAPSADNPTTFAPANDNKKDDLSVGSIIGIVVGVLGFIATSVGVYFGYKQYRNSHPTAAADPTQQERVGMMEHGVVYGHPRPPAAPNPNHGYRYDNGGYR